MRKKFVALLLTLTCLLGSPILAAAAPSNSLINMNCERAGTILYNTLHGAPRFEFIHIISSSISQSSGRATMTGSVGLYDANDTVIITLALQRSADGSKWSDVKAWTSNPITGRSRIAYEKAYYLTKGYYYRVTTTAEIESGQYLETVDCISNEIYY